MAWKNGGGETIELAIEPPGASLEDFAWRVSLAHVASDGPFSRFAGIDRTLAIVDGGGMVLAINGDEHVLTTTSPPFAFSGDAATTARLVDGPIVDLNAMTRRGRWSHTVTRLDAPTIVGAPGTVTVIVARSAVTIGVGSRVETLGVDDLAIAEILTIAPLEARMLAFAIELRPA